MANLKNLSERIKSVTSIQQVTKAMKMVAAAKVKKAQEKMEISRPYSKSTQDLICRILPQISVSDISLVEKRKVKNTGIIVITSDRGFAGSFNSSVIRLAEKEIEKLETELKPTLKSDYKRTERASATVNRLKRNVKLSEEIKKMYDYKCQGSQAYMNLAAEVLKKDKIALNSNL